MSYTAPLLSTRALNELRRTASEVLRILSIQCYVVYRHCICEGIEEIWNERATPWLKRAQKVNGVFFAHSVFHVFFVNQLREWSCQALFTWKTKYVPFNIPFSWIHLCSKRFL
jgi:hypothetical protein